MSEGDVTRVALRYAAMLLALVALLDMLATPIYASRPVAMAIVALMLAVLSRGER